MGEGRATWAAVQRLAAGLSERDRAIVADVARLRVLTSKQVQRLHFAELEGAHRDRTRRRALERLIALQLLAPLERRIGGVRAGSAGLVFALGSAGQRLVALDSQQAWSGRARRPSTPTERFLGHSLAISELYVGLVEAGRGGLLTLATFDTEPGCWWQDSEGEWIKPDAYAVVSGSDVEDAWAIEADMATESLPTLRRKLVCYLNLVEHSERGPDGGSLPRVLVAVPNERRLVAVCELVRSLPEPAEQLFAVATQPAAVGFLTEVLKE